MLYFIIFTVKRNGIDKLNRIQDIKKCLRSDFPDAEAFNFNSFHPYVGFESSGLSFAVNFTMDYEPYHDIVIHQFLKLNERYVFSA